MTDYKISGSDIAVDSAGRFIRLSDTEAAFQRAIISISAKLGEFVYDRSLGSRRDEIEPKEENSAERLELILNEAVAGYKDTYVSVLEYSDKIKVKITIGNETRETEVSV